MASLRTSFPRVLRPSRRSESRILLAAASSEARTAAWAAAIEARLSFWYSNAGPGRIDSPRAEAARHRFDPNLWFGNVELVTAREVGMESATNVANISKYHIAYALVVEAEARKR
jgi:hypothetical protein